MTFFTNINYYFALLGMKINSQYKI